MSILGNSDDSLLNAISIGVFVALCGVSVALVMRLRVHEASAVVGRDRFPMQRRTAELIFSLCLGLTGWLVAQYALLILLHLVPVAGRPAPPMTLADKALFSIVPPTAFFATLCAADVVIGGWSLICDLGLNPQRAAAGVLWGILGALIILPPTYALSFVTEWVYRAIHYEHPHEHDLLKYMVESPSLLIKLSFIAAAVVVAPLAEEFVFRGHLQTLLKRLAIILSSNQSQPPAGAFPVLTPPIPGDPIRLPIPETRIPQTPPVWQTWLAIACTSFLFAIVHPMWTWPTIFILSAGLGYCYERTGNIWTNVTVHCLFNAVSVSVYLFLQKP